MEIGISTACFYPAETEAALETVGRLGVPVTEIFFNTYRELKPAFLDHLLDIRDAYGLRISAIHTFTAAADTLLFFSDYERRFEDGMDLMQCFFRAAETLGARHIVMHGNKKVGKLPDSEVAARYLRLAEAAEEHGLCVLQENVNNFRSADPAYLTMLRELTDDRVCFCFDVKQAVRSGHTPDEILDAMGDRVRHLHLSDHSVASDCLLPGRGGYDFSALFRRMETIGYRGDAVIEVYRDAYRSPAEIKNSLKSFIF